LGQQVRWEDSHDCLEEYIKGLTLNVSWWTMTNHGPFKMARVLCGELLNMTLMMVVMRTLQVDSTIQAFAKLLSGRLPNGFKHLMFCVMSVNKSVVKTICMIHDQCFDSQFT
jgi:hypothetical protein